MIPTSVAYSPDGSTLAIRCADATIRLMDRSNRKETVVKWFVEDGGDDRSFPIPKLDFVGFSRDGKALASINSHEPPDKQLYLKIWLTNNLKEVGAVALPPGIVAIDIGSEGAAVIATDGTKIYEWNTK